MKWLWLIMATMQWIVVIVRINRDNTLPWLNLFLAIIWSILYLVNVFVLEDE